MPLDLTHRPRRLRRTPALRALVRETHLEPAQFIYPLFVCPGEGVNKPIGSMPGVAQMSVDEIVREVGAAAGDGVTSVLLFGLPAHKDERGSSASDPQGPVQQAVRAIRAAHPATARHSATKLARRFVSDDPPAALVARVSARFLETGGDLREVTRTLIMSPEFVAAEARRAKVKTPLEFVTSAMRATGRGVGDARPLLRGLQQLGMAPYMCQPPTGYDDEAATWVSAGALVSRMNIARQIAGPQAAVIGGPAFQRR